MASVLATAADLGSSAGGRAWILSAMSVGLAGVLLLSGAIGDAVGRRRVYLVGLVAVGLGAMGCATATSTTLFIIGRVLEGAGGAAVLACGLAILSATHVGSERSRATAVWGASVGLGITLGSIIPVVFAFGSGWRETYAVVGVFTLALARPTARLVPESTALVPRRLDLPGAATLCAAITLLVSALTESRSGVGPVVIELGLAAVVLVAVFGLIESRTRQPLVEFTLLRSPGFAAATLGALATGVGIIGMASNVPAMMQSGLGHPLWLATGIVALWSGASVATSLVLRRRPIPRRGSTTLAAALAVVGFAQVVALGGARSGAEWRIGLSLLLAGLATGVLNATLGREAVASVPSDRAAMGSGSNNTARYLGAAIGITAFTVLSHTGHIGSADAVSAHWNTAVLVSAAATVVGAGLVALAGRQRAAV